MATETNVKAVASGTHLTSIGTVKAVIGLVKAVDQNGIERVLQAGDTVYANETIVTAGDGTILIEFQDGSHLDLPHSSHIVLDTDIYAPKENVEQKAEDEAARIEKAIAEGRDPSIVTDAAAAGGAGGDEGSSTPLVIDFNNTQGNVNSGFPTGPISQTFASSAEILQPTVPTQTPTASVGVTVGVSTSGGDGGGVTILPPGSVVPVAGPSSANIIEGSDGGSRTVTFLITLDQPSTTPVTITYTIVPVTATNPGDYFDGATTKTITIPAGSPGFTVTENIVQDQYIEANETFKIVLSNPIGVTLANDTATVVIVDDDKAVNDIAQVQEGTHTTETEAGVVAVANTVQGNVLTNDPVSPDETSFVTNPGTYTTALGGTLVLNADGSYTYTAPAHVNNPEGAPVVDTFTYTMGTSGGGASSAQLNITITDTGPTAVNDGPVGVKEDDAQANAVGGNVLLNDSTGADVPVTVNWAATETNISDYGSLTLNKDGTYSFILDNTKQATQALAEGQQLTYQFTYTITDADGTTSNPAVLTITINGTNDVPKITGDAAGAVVEAGNADAGTAISGTTTTDPGAATAGTPTATGTLTATDPDQGATATWSGSAAGTYGNFAINATTGVWTYNLDNTKTATNALAEGQTATEKFTVTVTDDKGATSTQDVTITITGANDSPVISFTTGADAGTVKEDTTLTTTGQLTSADPDTGATATWSVSPNSPTTSSAYGTFSVDSSGKWTYTLDNSSTAVQSLAQGQTVTETYTVRVMDDKGAWDDQQVTITINGTNDAPTIQINNNGQTVYESGLPAGTQVSPTTTTVNGTFTLSDPDTLDKPAVQTGVYHGTYGDLTVSLVSGQYVWSYTLLTNVTNTAPGTGTTSTSGTDSIAVTVSDGHGGTATANVNITIVDDVPVVNSVVTGYIANDSVTLSQGSIINVNYGADGANAIHAVSGLTGTPPAGLTYHTDYNSDGSATLTAYDSTSALIFTLNVLTTGQYTFQMNHPNPTVDLTASLTGLTGSQPVDYLPVQLSSSLYAVFSGDGNGDGIVTGKQDGIKSSTDGLGVQNNILNSGETMYLQFASNSAGTNHVDVSNVSFSAGNMSGGNHVYWTAWAWDAATQTEVEVAHGTYTAPAGTNSSQNLAINLATTLDSNSGPLVPFDQLHVTTDASVKFVSMTASEQLFTGSTDLSFASTFQDGDGDTTTATLPITIEGRDSTGYHFTGTDGADAMQGSNSADIMNGGAGNDILVGGQGDDVLTGGLGSDTFKYNSGDLTGVTNGDTITDFKVDTIANGGDVLDITALLTGTHAADGSTLISGGYLHFDSITQNTDGTTTVKLSVDADGSAGSASSFVPLATITMSGLAAGATQADILNALVNNHEIKA